MHALIGRGTCTRSRTVVGDAGRPDTARAGSPEDDPRTLGGDGRRQSSDGAEDRGRQAQHPRDHACPDPGRPGLRLG